MRQIPIKDRDRKRYYGWSPVVIPGAEDLAYSARIEMIKEFPLWDHRVEVRERGDKYLFEIILEIADSANGRHEYSSHIFVEKKAVEDFNAVNIGKAHLFLTHLDEFKHQFWGRVKDLMKKGLIV